MASRILSATALAAILTLQLSAAEYHYDDYSAGRSFFTDGQEWIFSRADRNGTQSAYSVKATVTGDTVISSYMDYMGDIVRVDQPCKSIRVTTDEPGAKPQHFAAYEWDAEVYVYSDMAKDFVMLLNFNKPENIKILYNGEKWNTDRVDYVAPHGRLLKRYACSGVGTDKSSRWIYRVGADRVWLSDSKWSNPGSLTLVSYHDPKDDATYLPEDFDADTFVADNKFYTDGKEWIYLSAYHESKGNPDVPVHAKVSADQEADHVNCKRIDYFIEGNDSEYSSTVCSAGNVMYERGYMDMLVPRFDFNLTPGDRAVDREAMSEVVGVDYVSVNDINRKRIIFKGESKDSAWKYWVEGIGGNAGNDALPREEMEDMPEAYVPGTFVRCIEDGRTVFEQSDFNKDRSGIEVVGTDDAPGILNGNAFTLDGLRSTGITSSGISGGRIVVIAGQKYLLK